MPRNPDWATDELILALDLFIRSGRRQLPSTDPAVVALSELLNRLPIHDSANRDEAFRNPNGVSMKLGNFLRFEPSYAGKGLPRGSRAEKEVWDAFAETPDLLHSTAAAIRTIGSANPSPKVAAADDEPDFEFPEGRLLTRIHQSRERSRALVQRKKARVLKLTGKLACEICSFDFLLFYGPVGEGFIECHHTAPLAQLTKQSITRLADLVIVCANCHRVLHRHRPMLSVKALRDILAQRTSLPTSSQ